MIVGNVGTVGTASRVLPSASSPSQGNSDGLKRAARTVLGSAVGLLAGGAAILVDGPGAASEAAVKAGGIKNKSDADFVLRNLFVIGMGMQGLVLGGPLGVFINLIGGVLFWNSQGDGIRGQIFQVADKAAQLVTGDLGSNDDRSSLKKFAHALLALPVGYAAGAVKGFQLNFERGKKAGEKLADRLTGQPVTP